MNKVLKKTVIMYAAAAMLLGVCGCEKNEVGADITEIKWYDYGSQSPDAQKVFDKVNEYTKEKIGVRVDYTVIAAAEYNEKMKMLLA